MSNWVKNILLAAELTDGRRAEERWKHCCCHNFSAVSPQYFRIVEKYFPFWTDDSVSDRVNEPRENICDIRTTKLFQLRKIFDSTVVH